MDQKYLNLKINKIYLLQLFNFSQFINPGFIIKIKNCLNIYLYILTIIKQSISFSSVTNSKRNIQTKIMQQQQQAKRQQFSSYSISQTHNIVVQNILTNYQIKFIAIHRIDHIKMLFKNKHQYRYINCLIAAGRNFIKLYAVYSQSHYEELAHYKIYEDITAIYSWDKVIVVQTKQNIVGLIYQDSILKNAFMLSLEFLPLNPKDQCVCAFDKHGLLFTVKIKNFLLLCLSDSIISKYKSKPLYKQYTEIITQDIKWNRPQKAYIEEIIKIKVSDFELSQISNINICNQSIYFVGLKNFQKPNQKGEFHEKAFYHIQVPSFFTLSTQTNKSPICQFLAKKDDQVESMIPYVFNKQMECLFCKRDSIYVQIGRDMVMVDDYQGQHYEIVHKVLGENFSLWVKTGNLLRAYYRNKNTFESKNFNINFNFSQFLLKQELSLGQGTIIYSNSTELSMLKIDLSFVKTLLNKTDNQIDQQVTLSQKSSVLIHRSFGNIVDFQLGKNSIFIIESKEVVNQSEAELKQIKSKCYQLRRSLMADPKPYITHEKKNFLEALLIKDKFKSIKTLKFRLMVNINNSAINQQSAHLISDNLIVTQGQSKTDRFIFYRQTTGQINKETGQVVGLQKVLENIMHYAKITFEQKEYLVLIDSKGHLHVEKDGSIKELTTDKPQININDKMNDKLYFIDNFLIYQVSHSERQKRTLKFIEIFQKQQPFEIELPITKNIVNLFISRKTYSFRKKDKNILVIEITAVYENSIEILQFYTEIKDLRVVYKCENVSKGLPYLSNYVNYSNIENKAIFEKDRLRSITCPQYILSQYHATFKQHFIKNSGMYLYKDFSYLFFINSIDELIVYKKCLSFQSQCGYVYKRVTLPLNIIKVFKYTDEQNVIEQIGEGIMKIANVIICKGEFFQHNVNQLSFFQMDSALWTIEKEKIKMIDLKPLAGSNQPLFRQSVRKDSKDFSLGSSQSYKNANTLQENIEILNNFILTPIRTLMRKQLMGIQISGDYFIIYSKSGFQVLNQKDMKPVWACNLSSQNPQRREVIINVKAYEHFIAVSYYDYILDQSSDYKSIKFKFRIYNILSKKKILEKPKTTDQPILHIRPISAEKILIATSSTLYIYLIKAQKALEPIRTRNFSKRFGLSSFSYIPEVFDEKNRSHKPCYMLCANQFGGLSFFVGKWLQNDVLREMWFEKLRCQVRNVQIFLYGQELKGLITDQDGNLIVINIKPDTPQQAAKAQKIADMNVGSKANVLRIRHDQDRKIYGCFEDGTIKIISAVKLDNPEISFIDFQQETFCKQIPLLGGFNQRISRLLNQKYRTFKYVSRGNMLDCDILEEFFSMTVSLKQYILQKSQFKINQLKAILRSI